MNDNGNAHRERFEPAELSAALSRYDLGKVRSIREFLRGSRRAPKVLIEADTGNYFFKRRPRYKDDPQKVALTHQVQLYLAAQGFPLPHLIGTRNSNNSMLVINGGIYEMFEYVEGESYDNSLGATHHAGRVLGLFHRLTLGFKSELRPPRGGYHDARQIHLAVSGAIEALRNTNGDNDPDARRQLGEQIEQAYRVCAGRANQLGLKDWPEQLVHGDWHPGNMLFRDGEVSAVIDYDTICIQQRVLDIANGALQFSITTGGADPDMWSEHTDLARLKAFLIGYDAASVISKDELAAVPMLMCEALIAEAVLPVAATGAFGRFEGMPFLRMILRKVERIMNQADQIASLLHT